MPPEVGNADTSFGHAEPITRMKIETIGQPQKIASGRRCSSDRKVVKQPARMEMMENEIAKLEKPDQVRLSSCL